MSAFQHTATSFERGLELKAVARRFPGGLEWGMASTEATQVPTSAPLKRARPKWKRPAKVRDELDLTQLDFVGCEAVYMSPAQYRLFEGRLEVWDAELKTAWMVRESPPTFIHESPSQRLAGLAERIAAVRGSPIAYCGALGLMVSDQRGDPRRVMQPDQAIYVNPTRAELEGRGAILVGEHRLPDLVMEVDNTTDVRRGKLKLYESWGFPELWVEVPDRESPSRPAGLRPRLTIHLLEGGSYRISSESRAFPGWRAEDIHAALNEFALSERSLALVERIGRTLGEREGTGPDDDPMLRSLRAESEAKGITKGRVESRARTAHTLLLARGIELSEGFLADPSVLAELPESAIVAAAQACDSERDFLLRLGRRQP